MMSDSTLEEMWRIKEELSAAETSWEEYAAELYAFQEEERKRGVKFVSPTSYAPLADDVNTATLSVAEEGREYDACISEI